MFSASMTQSIRRVPIALNAIFRAAARKKSITVKRDESVISVLTAMNPSFHFHLVSLKKLLLCP